MNHNNQVKRPLEGPGQGDNNNGALAGSGETNAQGRHEYFGNCGADITAWFCKEIELHLRYALATQALDLKMGPDIAFIAGSWARQAGMMVTPPPGTFSSGDCPTDAHYCNETATICKLCLHQSQVWNILYGIIGPTFFGEDILRIAAWLEGGFHDTAEDRAAYQAGFEIRRNLNLGNFKFAEEININPDEFCRAFTQAVNNNPELLRVTEKADPANRINFNETCRPCPHQYALGNPHTISAAQVTKHENFAKNWKRPEEVIVEKLGGLLKGLGRKLKKLWDKF